MLFSSNVIHSVALVGSLLPAVRCAVFDVVVGGTGILRYNPEFVTAAPGDQVRFVFRSKNHTATQSSFANPCLPLAGGFDSGYIPVADDTADGIVAALNISNTDPIWVYCKQGAHCKNGMVFAVNPGNRFDAFKAAAASGVAPTAATTGTPVATGTAATPSASPTSPVTLTGIDHKVIVGGAAGLVYEPANITAQPGDTITFEFRAKNHTVTASTFDTPCVPLLQSNSASWDSGYFPVSADQTSNFPTYQIVVNDTKPIWAYCAQGNHCGSGMVFSANAVETGGRNFAAFKALAMQLNGTAGTASPYAAALSTRSSMTSAGAAVIALVASIFVF